MAYQNIVPLRLSQDTMTTTLSVTYRTPFNVRTYVKDIDISNTTSTSINVSVFLVPNNNSTGTTVATTANALFYNVPVPGNSTLQWTGAQILNPSDTIQIQASASGCTITVTGGEAT